MAKRDDPVSVFPRGPAGLELAHGFTLGDLEHLAMAAATRSVYHRSVPLPDRIEIAYSAIVEQLYAAAEKPQGRGLIRAAWKAIQDHAEDEWRTHGIARNAVIEGESTMPNYWRYWWNQTRPTPSPEDRIVERIALRQVFDQLPPYRQRLILLKAVHRDNASAAAARGTSRQSYVKMLYQARRHFLAIWHEGEQPPRLWMDRKSNNPSGRRISATDVVARRKKRRERTALVSENADHGSAVGLS